MTSTANPTGYEIASRVETLTPDTLTSAGARFLTTAYAAAVEGIRFAVENGDDLDDLRAEVADSCVPVYTHDKWEAFVDLGAYREDVSDFTTASNLDSMAGIALYLIAGRVFDAAREDIND